MQIKYILSVLLSVVVFINANTYEGYKIYDINTENEFQKNILVRLSNYVDYDFFSMPRAVGVPTRVMVQPDEQFEFESILKIFKFDYVIVSEDVAKTIEFESEQNSMLRSAFDRSSVSFDKYLRFGEINAYLDELAKTYANRVQVKTIGKSYEQREMKAITITNGDGRSNKKVILVDGGIHAREWIAPAGALYIIYQLAENYNENAHLLKDYDWIILPVVNPDGYEYTHTNSRMWRKTRKPVTATCAGTDANRNFDFHWGEVGASSVSCSDTFMGTKAFSEPETQVVRDLMHSLSGRAKFYLTLHSYGNYLLYPWGYTSALPSTWRDIDAIAQAGAAAIRATTGTKYTVGSSTNVLYAAAGGSDDYALARANIPITITMELPAGGSGFNPSVAQIKPFVTETWVGIKAMAEAVVAKF